MDADLLSSLAKLLSPILSSPDALHSLAAMLGGASGESDERGEASAEDASVAASAEPSGVDRGKRREALLRALHPYLSKRKGERLEGLVRASAVLDAIGGAGRI